ncbi:MAG: ATP-dependent DNA helicase [Rhodoferax sp.]|uniref:ATP-dependent DNA helicase n=1 Tax=Rhodoferax sp. TaxID=50421 RepID=UPI003015B3FC
MSLQEVVGDAFTPDGLLSRTIEAFMPRAGQTEMASAVARTIDNGGVLVVEAGTGIGKTFSYLVPALLSGNRVLVSTATKTLQDQLFGRDIPQLVKVLGLPVRTALLKGRSSYLCLYRLEIARHDLNLPEHLAARTLAKVEQWAQVTQTGDLSELPGLDERSPVIPFVTSSRDNCLGAQCPQFRDCHVNLARRKALAADVVVVNHHLFFADLAVRDSGVAELLPSVQTVIFDEAHQLNETGVQFMGNQLTTGQLLDFARDLMAVGLLHARGLLDWHALASELEHAARDLRLVVGKSYPGAKLRWVGESPELVDAIEWKEAMDAVHASCIKVNFGLETVSEIAPELVRLSERNQEFIDRINFFSGSCQLDSVRWLDVGIQLRLVESPLDICNTVKSRMIQANDELVGRKSWIFTSATLGNDAKLRWFTEPCGLDEAEILKVESPFDYSAQAVVYVPQHLPKPNDPTHSAQVAEFVANAAAVIGGRTLVLTTTLRALKVVADSLRQWFSNSKNLDILEQGEMPKRELIERFRLGNQDGRAGCILVASASFWEGVDVPGDALQMVVIDKLPFPPPSDPQVEARSKRLESNGKSVFNSYFMREAALALKQGAGRLIRHESDRGILVICDTRVSSMGYGRRLLAALPPMRRINSEAEMAIELNALTRPSTMDPSWI